VEYDYDANQNLTSVTYADGSGFDYIYNDTYQVHNLTGKNDKLDHQLNTWTYDRYDRCIDNFSRDGQGLNLIYVTDTRVEVTDDYGVLRTYTIAEISGRKRVAAMQGAAGLPYSDSNAVRWVYNNKLNLTEVEYASGTLSHYQNYDKRGNPQTVKYKGSARQMRTVTYTYHPWMNVPLTRTEQGVLGSGYKVTTWDYDADDNHRPNENPTELLYRLVEEGFTRNRIGNVVAYQYVTSVGYNDRGQLSFVNGPLPGDEDVTEFGYDADSGDLLAIVQPLIGATTFSAYDDAGQPACPTLTAMRFVGYIIIS
jgi:hypothetical protein